MARADFQEPLNGDVFQEALLSHSPMPFFQELTLYAMRAFGGYDLSFAIYYGIAGGVMAGLCSYYVGRALHHMIAVRHMHSALQWQSRYALVMRRYLPILLLLSPLPFGFIVAVAAGIFRISLLWVLPFLVMSFALAYYLQFIQS